MRQGPFVAPPAPTWFAAGGLSIVAPGDSIAGGEPDYLGPFDGGPSGNIQNEIWYWLAQAYGPSFTYENHGTGGYTLADVLANRIAAVAALNPIAVPLICGVNDVNRGRDSAEMDSDCDGILAAFSGKRTKLFLCEILPDTNFDDTKAATIRTRNIQRAAWCSANNVPLVLCHDAMGTVRSSTGRIDDLNVLYTATDGLGVHLLTPAGPQAMAALIKARLDAYYG